MNSTTQGRKAFRRYAKERALAPHVDEKWAGSLILELRMLGVAGGDIGGALSEVESHCAESGQSAQAAFGHPVEYARSLELPTSGRESTRSVIRSLAPTLAQVVGMLILSSTFADWLRGEQLEVTTGHLVWFVALLGTVAIVKFADPILRLAVSHPIRGWLAFIASTAIFVATFIFLDGKAWQVSSAWGVAAGAAILVAGVAWAIAQYRADGSVADLVTSPFDPADASRASSHESARRPSEPFRVQTRMGMAITVLMIPVATLLLLALDLVMHQMSTR